MMVPVLAKELDEIFQSTKPQCFADQISLSNLYFQHAAAKVSLGKNLMQSAIKNHKSLSYTSYFKPDQ